MKREKPQINLKLKKGESALDLLVDADVKRSVVYGYYFDDETVQHLTVNGVEVSGCMFVNCRFQDCLFEGVSFLNCYFKNCDFSFMNMHQSSFTCCEIVESKMTGLNLSFGVLNHLLVRSTNCRFVNFSECKVTVTNFVSCDLSSADMDKVRLKDSEFVQCNLTGMNICGTSFEGMNLRGNRLDKLVFMGGELQGATVDSAQAIALIRLIGIHVDDNGSPAYGQGKNKR
ncbi:MAG: pentapeptide repeat-containing protein [Clostridia bacterium]|nr:pentapeptide repeat-containing protein [Clostridia bacterium]